MIPPNDVNAWRKVERSRLIAQRLALPIASVIPENGAMPYWSSPGLIHGCPVWNAELEK